MRLAIKNARIVDPATGRDGTGDLYIADGKIGGEGGRVDRAMRGIEHAAPRRAVLGENRESEIAAHSATRSSRQASP